MIRRAFLFGLVLAAAVPAGSAFAQNARIAATVPFEFQAGNRKLAAGEYTITKAVANDPRVFAFRGSAQHQKAVVQTTLTTGGKAAEATELTFAKYGDVYYLRSFRLHGDVNLYAVRMSKEEGKALVAKGTNAETITLKASK